MDLIVHLFENPTLGAMARLIDPTANNNSPDDVIPAPLAPMGSTHSRDVSS